MFGFPAQYNPKLRQLKVYSRIRFTLHSSDRDPNNFLPRGKTLTQFEANQAKALVLNNREVLAQTRTQTQKNVLILTTSDLLNAAESLGGYYENNTVQYEVFETTSSTEQNLISGCPNECI